MKTHFSKNTKYIAVSAVALVVASPALGQSTEGDDELIVTGTRILSPNMESPNPITSMNSQTLAYTGKSSVQEIVIEIGALVGSEGESEVSSGENFLILRNLGANRTLVLVDGHRFVGGFGGTSAVDTNTIPLAMIERVDVFTGGASAIYGADAVTGVVNFILKDDFEGLAFDGQYGNAEAGDFADHRYSLTAGHNFDDGRGNITGSYTYLRRPLTPATARAAASTEVHEQINNLNGPVPQFVLASGTRESFFTDGGARIDPFGVFSDGFNGDGTPFDHGVNVGSFAGTGEIGGDGIPNWKLFAQGIRPQNYSHLATIKTHYEVAESFVPYLNVNYSHVENRNLEQESLTVGSRAALDNAFLPASVATAANDAGLPFVFFNRWDLESGFIDSTVDKETWRIVGGARGALSEWLRYDFAVNIGRSNRETFIRNNRMFDRYIAAIDAVDDGSGNIVCRSTLDPDSFLTLGALNAASGVREGDFLATSFDIAQGAATFTPGSNSGCVPFDPFTTDSSVNQAAIDWIWTPTTENLENKQTVISGYFAGDTSQLFELPGGAADFVFGGEYRKEESAQTFDAFSGSPRTVAQVNGTNLAGEFDVIEGFTEVSLPVVADLGPLMQAFTIDAAYRFSDYSTIGSTHTWKAGGRWDLATGLTLRGTYSKAVRAPNISELFEARSNISVSLGQFDPCSVANLDLGTEFRRTNCAADLSALGIDPATFNPLLGTFFPAVSGGNPDLEEETARTKTFGFLWQPTFVEGLSLSADYFDIKIEDAVLRPSQQAIFQACYDSPTLDNVFCTLIGRDMASGAANFAELTSVNVAQIRTSGVEFTSRYQFPPTSIGDFSTQLNGTWLRRLDIQRSPLPVLTDEKGLFTTFLGGSSPEWVLNYDLGWRFGKWDANYGLNYSSRTLRPPLINAQRENAEDILQPAYVKAFFNHDLQIGYMLNDNARFYAGVTNLADAEPDLVRGSLNGASGRQGFAGRTYYVGVNINFGDIWN